MDSSGKSSAGSAKSAESTSPAVMAAVAEAIARLRFGAIELTVHDGKVVQLDVTERQRFS